MAAPPVPLGALSSPRLRSPAPPGGPRGVPSRGSLTHAHDPSPRPRAGRRGMIMDRGRHIDPAWVADHGMPGWEGYYCALCAGRDAGRLREPSLLVTLPGAAHSPLPPLSPAAAPGPADRDRSEVRLSRPGAPSSRRRAPHTSRLPRTCPHAGPRRLRPVPRLPPRPSPVQGRLPRHHPDPEGDRAGLSAFPGPLPPGLGRRRRLWLHEPGAPKGRATYE